MPDWKKIRKEYETTKITMKALAEKHDVKYATLRSRKSREKWGEDVATKDKKSGNKKESVATQQVVKELNENSDLNDRQKRFCLLYLKYFNATKAYQEAYEVSYKTAHSNAWQLMANKGIKKELSRLKEAQKQELYIDSLDVKQEWLKQAFADIGDYVKFETKEVDTHDELGNPITILKSFVKFKDQTEIDTSLIQEVKMGRDGPVIKLYDKQKAMDKLMEFLKESGDSGRELLVVRDDWIDEDE